MGGSILFSNVELTGAEGRSPKVSSTECKLTGHGVQTKMTSVPKKFD